MTGLNHLLLCCALLAASLGVASPAAAQCRLCDQPTTSGPVDSPGGDVQIQIETNLNFDRLILSGGGTGAVTVRPDGSSGSEGAVADVGPRVMVGTVLVHGQPGRAVRIDLPRRADLFSVSGGRLTVLDITSDAPADPRLDAAGNLSFRFGGRLVVTGEADGQYRGDLPITVEYQ